MAYDPENNPYIPGDPASYDLSWVVERLNKHKFAEESAADAKIQADRAKGQADRAKNEADQAENEADRASGFADDAEGYKNDASTIVNAVTPAVNANALAISTLEGRVNSFASLPPGSTAGNAELLDVRVAFDGYTFPSAGDATRKFEEAAASVAPSDVNGFYISGGYYVTEETGSPYSKILILPIKPGHKYMFYSTGGNRWRVCLGDKYDIYDGLLLTGIASESSFIGACYIDNSSYQKKFVYIYYYNGSTPTTLEYSLIDLDELDTTKANIFKGNWILNGVVREPAYDVETLVIPLVENTQYLLQINGGNRRNIALSNDAVPVENNVVNMLSTATDTNPVELEFNSGSYRYLYIYYRATGSPQNSEFHYELKPLKTDPLIKVYSYTDYNSSSSTPNTGRRLKIGSYNVAKYNNDTSTYISQQKLHNLKEEIAKMDCDILFINEDTGYIDAGQTKTSRDYIYRPVYPFRAGAGSNERIYTKLPLSGEALKSTPSGRKVIFVKLITDGITILLVCVHAKPGITATAQSDRAGDLTWLINEIANETYDYLIMGGDFNPEAGTPDITDMETKFAAANMLMCNGGRMDYMNTWFDPAHIYTDVIAREMPLDYVITSDNIICNSYKVYADDYWNLYSDHVPCVADLTLL